MTVQNIIDYLIKNSDCLNPNVIRGMLQQLQVSDNLDLSFVTAEAGDIRKGKIGASSTGAQIEGTYEIPPAVEETPAAEETPAEQQGE